MKRVLFSFLFVTCCVFSYALVALPSIFGDNMVLQQNSKVKIWGWAKPFEEITVTTSWDNKSYKVMTGNNMSWEVDVITPEGSFTPYEITVEGWRKLTLKNVLIGEVWHCSGQSNMEWS
ncbi:MAG: sialate O-acetylesterase, partial [Bacteroidales bacterium]|nr:sialate O-acetylesterase [Bacteroidales bacterium]